MVEERRSSLSWDMGGSFATGQANPESKQELTDVQVQLDQLKSSDNLNKKLVEEYGKKIEDLSEELLEIRRQNAEHEALSRILLFILSATSLVDLMVLMFKYAQRVGIDSDMAFAALEKLYGSVATKAAPHIIEVIKQGAVDDAIKSDLYNEVLDLKT